MKKNFILVMWLALVTGCIDHAVDRTNLAVDGAGHQIALEKCVDQAVKVKATAGADAAGDYYVSCADAADKAAGVKK